MGTPSTPASPGRRVAAGLVDGALLATLATAYWLVPLWTTGLMVPMWGVLMAVVGYSVVPLAAFGTTLGMRLFGLALQTREGHTPNPGDLLFRELVGRGFFPGAFLFTLVMGLVGSLLRWTTFVMPQGIGAVMALLSLLTLAVVVPGHLLALLRGDRRSLADLLGRTFVVVATPPAPIADDEERAYQRRLARRRAWGVLALEAFLVVGALALPRLLTQRTDSTEQYADRLLRARLEREFDAAPDNEQVATQLAEAYRKAGRPGDAARVEARLLEATLDNLPCQQRSALALADRMNREGRFDAALALVARYHQKCGPWPRLLWVSMYAHQQKGAWKEAAQVGTQLIDDEPLDSDYWWWRAEAYSKLGNYEQAAADYHQSMANRPNGFAAGRYAKWVDSQLQRPCEGAFALGYWMDRRPDKAAAWAKDERARLYLAGRCDELLGRGQASLKVDPDAPLSTAQLRVGRATGTVSLTQAGGYTLLKRDFALRAWLGTPSDATIEVWSAGRRVPAHLAVADEVWVGQAHAPKVLVAVVEDLPPGLDAVLGVNLAWRFKVTADERQLSLGALPSALPPSAR